MNLQSLTPLQLDALREVGNIGAGHAATALSKMLGVPVGMTVPQAAIVGLADVSDLVGGPETPAWAVYLTMSGDLDGHLVLLFAADRAAALVDLLMKRPTGTLLTLDAMGESALAEVGNILTANYLIAMGQFANLRLLPSPPLTAHDMVAAILDGVVAQVTADSDVVLVLETQLAIEKESSLAGFLVVLPAPDSLPKLLEALGIWDLPTAR